MEHQKMDHPFIGALLHQSSNNISRLLDQLTVKDHITGKQGRILGYLAHHTESPVYQRDIENLFGIRRSTVSSLIKHLEKNGFIKREDTSLDARMKQLILTPKGIAIHATIHEKIMEIESRIQSLYTEEEFKYFISFLNRCIQATKE